MPSSVEAARALVRQAKRIAVLTGAGVSAESGIPTFRSNGGFWQNQRFEDLATPQGFARDPKFVWEWYEERRRGIALAKPNAGHYALAEHGKARGAIYSDHAECGWAARSGGLGKHDQAAWRHLGWSAALGLRPTRQVERAELTALPPRCGCGGMLRPGVVWFGETLPEGAIERAAAGGRVRRTC